MSFGLHDKVGQSEPLLTYSHLMFYGRDIYGLWLSSDCALIIPFLWCGKTSVVIDTIIMYYCFC